jgi:hypothetical protein
MHPQKRLAFQDQWQFFLSKVYYAGAVATDLLIAIYL